MGMPDHHFNPKLAQDHGVDIAIFLHNIYHWIEYNKAYKKNFFDGRYWTFNSIAAFCEVHPYWSKRQIERIISVCKSSGLILSGCFNKDKRDRTAWYTLSDEAMEYFYDAPKTVECISPNGEMQTTERGHTFPQTVTTIPINKPDNKQTDNPPKSPQGGDAPSSKKRRREPKAAPDWKPERFEGFWRMYPVKKSKQAAIRAWDSLRPDDGLLAVMGRALQRQLASEDWRRGFGVPYPATWLNGQRWEDEDNPARKTAPAAQTLPAVPRLSHTEIINGEEVVVYDEPDA